MFSIVKVAHHQPVQGSLHSHSWRSGKLETPERVQVFTLNLWLLQSLLAKQR